IGGDERAPLEEQASTIPTAEVVRLVEALGDSLGRVKRGGDPKLELELTFLKLARDYTEPDVNSLLSRLEALEKALQNGGRGTAPRQPARQEVAARETGREELAQPAGLQPAEEVAESPRTGPDRAPEPPTREEGADEGVNLAVEWGSIMGELKRRRQALTAAVYGEARVESFDGKVLNLVYPEEQSFHVGMARDRGHLDKLGSVLEERLGSRPHLEVRAADGEAADVAPADEEPPLEVAPPPEKPSPGPRTGQEERPPGGSNGSVAVEGDPAPEASRGDDIIRDQREVFEMAREFGLFDQNRGS
ncbi:MAG: hypothetical protein M3Q49_04110, partial [Actinomycetota bacterium]|nr:hypothetical protein [Actinomycetota bacterium]